MKRLAILITLLVLFVTSAVAQRPPTLTDDDIESPKTKTEEKGKPTSASLPVGKADSAWTEFSSPEGGFSVKWPGKPLEKSQKVDTDSGQLDQKMFALEKNGVGYGVVYFDLPAPVRSAEEMEMRFTGIRNQLLKSGKVKLLGETAMTLAGYMGKEFQYEQGESLVTMKVFAFEQRVYSVFLVVQKGQPSTGTESPFFSSFRVIK